MQFLDAKSMLCVYRSCKWYFNMLLRSNAFWKMICVKEELANYSCIAEESTSSSLPLETNVIESSSFQTNEGLVNLHKDNKTTSENSSEPSNEPVFKDLIVDDIKESEKTIIPDTINKTSSQNDNYNTVSKSFEEEEKEVGTTVMSSEPSQEPALKHTPTDQSEELAVKETHSVKDITESERLITSESEDNKSSGKDLITEASKQFENMKEKVKTRRTTCS